MQPVYSNTPSISHIGQSVIMQPSQLEIKPVHDVDNESSYSSLSEFGDDHLEHSDIKYIKTLKNSKELNTILYMYKPKITKWRRELDSLKEMKAGGRTFSSAFGEAKSIDQKISAAKFRAKLYADFVH